MEMSIEYKYNFFIRLGIETFLESWILSLLSIRYTKLNSFSQFTSFGMSIFFFVLYFGFQIWTFFYIRKNMERILKEGGEGFPSVSVLIEEYRPSKWSAHFNSIFFARRLIYAIIIVFAYEYPLIQTIIFLTVWFLVFLYQVIVRPYKLKLLNIFMILNELTIVVLCCTFFLFINPISDSYKNNVLGWMWVGIVTAVLIANLGYLIYYQIKTIVSIVKKVFTRTSKMTLNDSNLVGSKNGKKSFNLLF